ncbi:hypothetical protein BGZ81_006129 [Podila clonocystis]|nr:hypothetical protein BGZ81_006129 [Podila clonocystis]
MNSGTVAKNMEAPSPYSHISKDQTLNPNSGETPTPPSPSPTPPSPSPTPPTRTPPTPTPPQTLRKIIIFLAFVCLVMDIVITSTRPYGYTALGHIFGIILPDFLALTMFTKYVRNGLGRYPPRTRITLFTLLLTAGLMWPIFSFVYTGAVYISDGQIWDAYGLNRYIVFFCTVEFQPYVNSSTATFIHMVRSRDFFCMFYLLLAGIELFKSLRMFRTTAADAEKGTIKGASVEAVEDGEEIAMAPHDQKVDEDKDFKNEVEAEFGQ